MLRGSYAGGSLNVTARRPCRRPGPSAILLARVQAPVPRGTLPDFVSTATRRLAPPSYAPAIRGCATPLRTSATLCRCITEHCCSFAFDRRASRRHAIAMHCPGSRSLSLAPLSHDVPLRCIAFQSRRPANLGGALPSPCHVSLCLRHALLSKATPSLPVSVHRRRMPRLCFAVALHSTALRRGAVAARGPSWPSYPMPLRVGSLPVLRGAVRSLLLLRISLLSCAALHRRR